MLAATCTSQASPAIRCHERQTVSHSQVAMLGAAGESVGWHTGTGTKPGMVHMSSSSWGKRDDLSASSLGRDLHESLGLSLNFEFRSIKAKARRHYAFGISVSEELHKKCRSRWPILESAKASSDGSEAAVRARQYGEVDTIWNSCCEGSVQRGPGPQRHPSRKLQRAPFAPYTNFYVTWYTSHIPICS